MGVPNDLPLLSTKLKMPAPRRDYIIRRALFEKLSCCSDMGVIFVCGGAGTGKTTLLSTFIRETELENVGWLTLDVSNSNVYSFWYYFAEAANKFLGKDDDFLTLLRSAFDASHMEGLLTLLINRLFSEEDYYIVLDDIHCIKDAALMRTLEFFIGAMPENLHLFMLSREEPPVYLGSLAVSGRLQYIDGRQMQLSQEEGMEFLKQTLKLNCSEKELTQLNTYAEGWIGGLQLAAAAQKAGRNSGALLQAGGGIAAEYLSREIFESLTPDERDFLLVTGFPAYFDADLCGRLFQNFTQTDFNEMMEKLTQKNLFIICIDEKSGIYRYHNILSDYLCIEYSHLPEERRKALFTNSAIAFEERGDLVESLREFCIAMDYKNVMRVAHNMEGSIEAWCYLNQVPLDELIEDADLAAQCLLYNFGILNARRCRTLYEKLRERYEGTDTFHVIQFAEAYVSANTGCLPQYQALTVGQIEALHFGPATKSMVFVQNANVLMEHLQYKEAERCINLADKICAGSNIFVQIYIINERAQIFEETGRLNKSLVCHSKAAELFKSPAMMVGIEVNSHIGLTGVYMRRMELDIAEKLLTEAQAMLSRLHGHLPIVDMALACHLAELKLLRGEAAAGSANIDGILSELPALNILNLSRLVHELCCEGLLKRELGEAFLQDLEKAENYQIQPFMRLLRARILFENDQTENALQETDNVMTFARAQKNYLRLVEANLQKIYMLSRCSKSPEQNRRIKNLLREAVYYAYENRIFMPFYLDRQTILPLLREINAQDFAKSNFSCEESQFIKDAAAICSNTAVSAREQEILSARELDILNELAGGFTNREIADKLCISQATVKTHVLNIFGKLGVSSRLLAVEEGRKRELIN